MTKLMQQILANKAEGRRELAALSIDLKIAKLEKMRDRRELIASSPLRRSVAAGTYRDSHSPRLGFSP